MRPGRRADGARGPRRRGAAVSKRIVVNVGLTETRVAVQEGNLLTELYSSGTATAPSWAASTRAWSPTSCPACRRRSSTSGSARTPSSTPATTPPISATPVRRWPGPTRTTTPTPRPTARATRSPRTRGARAHRGAAPQEPGGPRPGLQGVARAPRAPASRRSSRIPGRYLVYMPQARHVGVSRRIRDERERERLRGVAARRCSLPPGGFIVRTNAEGKGEEEFAADVEFLAPPVERRSRRASSRRAAPAVLARGDGPHLPRGARPLLARGRRVRGRHRARSTSKCVRVRRRRWCPQLADRVRLYEERDADLRGHSASRRTSRRRCAGGCG